MKSSDLIEEEIKKLIEDQKFEFHCSQRSISLPIINRIRHKMILGIKFPEIKVCKNIIIDGHHRYLASKIASVDLQKIYLTEVNNLESKRWHELLIDGATGTCLNRFSNTFKLMPNTIKLVLKNYCHCLNSPNFIMA